VPADNASHTVLVQCAADKAALGGGFRVPSDQPQPVSKEIAVLASEPAQVGDDGAVVTPMTGVPNAWLLEVVNHGDVDQSITTWVVCATIAQ
jgi:hypothetical protein